MKNLLGGFAGAVALNILHETYKRIDPKAPHIDLVGEEALTKIIKASGNKAPKGNTLFISTLGADVLANTLYYALIGNGNKKNVKLRGLIYGLTAGISAVTLTKQLGLRDAPLNRFQRTKIITVLLYTIGGLISGAAISNMNK